MSLCAEGSSSWKPPLTACTALFSHPGAFPKRRASPFSRLCRTLAALYPCAGVDVHACTARALWTHAIAGKSRRKGGSLPGNLSFQERGRGGTELSTQLVAGREGGRWARKDNKSEGNVCPELICRSLPGKLRASCAMHPNILAARRMPFSTVDTAFFILQCLCTFFFR